MFLCMLALVLFNKILQVAKGFLVAVRLTTLVKDTMQEAIDFQMDQYGARVTSVAMEIGADSAGMAPPVPKKLLLNKPYWVIMKRKDSPRPYFILGVRNTAMMKAAD